MIKQKGNRIPYLFKLKSHVSHNSRDLSTMPPRLPDSLDGLNRGGLDNRSARVGILAYIDDFTLYTNVESVQPNIFWRRLVRFTGPITTSRSSTYFQTLNYSAFQIIRKSTLGPLTLHGVCEPHREAKYLFHLFDLYTPFNLAKIRLV